MRKIHVEHPTREGRTICGRTYRPGEDAPFIPLHTKPDPEAPYPTCSTCRHRFTASIYKYQPHAYALDAEPPESA